MLVAKSEIRVRLSDVVRRQADNVKMLSRDRVTVDGF
jgi:hypothetical protein